MQEREKQLEDVVLTRLLRLNAIATGVVTGLAFGLAVFAATNWLVLKGGEVVGPHLVLLNQFFIGYQVTFPGSLVGFANAFVLGFAVAYFVARVYNWIVELRTAKWTK